MSLLWITRAINLLLILPGKFRTYLLLSILAG